VDAASISDSGNKGYLAFQSKTGAGSPPSADC